MEGRVTRSRAKALGTPLAAMPAQLPEPRTTGRRRKNAVLQAENQETSKKLEFADEASALANVPEDQLPEVTVEALPVQNSEAESLREASSSVLSPSLGVLDEASSLPEVTVEDAPVQNSDAELLLEASPSVLSPSLGLLDEDSSLPEEVTIDDAPIQNSEAELLPEATPSVLSPSLGVLDEASYLPNVSHAACVMGDASPLPPSSPTDGIIDPAHPTPIATTPATSSAVGVVGLATPSPGSPPAASPVPSIMATDASPLPMIGSPEFIQAVAPSPDAVNDNAVPTPISFTSDAPSILGGFAQPANASIPATPLSFTDMVAHGEELPGDDVELDGSPISLSGDAFHLPEPTPQQHMGAGFHGHMDTDMADSTPVGAYNVTSSPLTYISDRLLMDVNPSPAVSLLGEPLSVPHNAAVPDSDRSPAEITTFKGFSAGPTGLEANSPSMGSVLPAIAAGSVAIASPLEESILPRAPAPTPVEVMTNGPVPTLVADVCATLTSESDIPVGDMDVEMDATPVSDLLADCSASCLAGEMSALGHAVSTATEATVPTPVANKTPSAVVGRTPLAGSASRAPTPKLTTSKAAGAAVTPVAPSTKTKTSYISVPSRYMSPAISKQQSTATPVAATNTAAVSKPTKRVSINTPEGPRVATSHRPHVVPTPFRPKSGERSPVDIGPSAPDAPMEAMDGAGPSDERRAKAAERLKTIHATEHNTASTSSGPGYLAPTKAFTVKTDKGVVDKCVKSKAEGGNYDSRSLRQLKRDVAELKAKKAMSSARETKLTPKVADRPLPMPEENSDDEADYDEGQENALVQAMTGLEVAPPKKAVAPLRGVPAPQGKHIRFGDDGKTSESPKRVVLRGLPVATGKYKRFE